MKQLTAKTVEDVLQWIEATPHHRGSWVEAPGFFVLAGRNDKLRIPEDVQEAARPFYQPAPDHFDTRMFRATPAGKARLTRSRKTQSPTLTEGK